MINEFAELLASFEFTSSEIGGVLRAEKEEAGTLVGLTVRPHGERWTYYLHGPAWSSFGVFSTVDELRYLLDLFAPRAFTSHEVAHA